MSLPSSSSPPPSDQVSADRKIASVMSGPRKLAFSAGGSMASSMWLSCSTWSEHSSGVSTAATTTKLNALGFRFVSRRIYICFLVLFLSIHPSIHPSIRLSVCLSIYLSIYLSVCLSVCLSVYLSIYLSIYLSKYLSIWSICLSVCLTIYHLSVCLSISSPSLRLSVRLSACPSVYLSVYLHPRCSPCWGLWVGWWSWVSCPPCRRAVPPGSGRCRPARTCRTAGWAPRAPFRWRARCTSAPSRAGTPGSWGPRTPSRSATPWRARRSAGRPPGEINHCRGQSLPTHGSIQLLLQIPPQRYTEQNGTFLISFIKKMPLLDFTWIRSGLPNQKHQIVPRKPSPSWWSLRHCWQVRQCLPLQSNAGKI